MFVKVLGEVRDRYQFELVGYVVMPEHSHLLVSESARGTPSTVMQVLKQRVSRQMRKRKRRRVGETQLAFPFGALEPQEDDGETRIHAPQSREARVGGSSEGLGVE